jgi:hypothetical protein
MSAFSAKKLHFGEAAAGDVFEGFGDVAAWAKKLQISRRRFPFIPVQSSPVGHFVVLAAPGSDAVKLQVLGGGAMGALVPEE